MDVFDSNVWIYGLTRTCEEAVALVDQAVNTAYHVGVNAYIFDEVVYNIQRSDLEQNEIDRLQTRFADIVYGNHTVHGPTQEEISQMDLEAWREDSRVQAMAEAFGVQAKDVPIVVFAHQCAQRVNSPSTTIHTADKGFSKFKPRNHFEKVEIEYVDCTV